MMKVESKPLEWFIDRIAARKPFSFSRWGDGEWLSILGRTRGANCDKHRYFPQMGPDLARVLLSRPAYLLGMQPLAQRVMGDKITNWLERNKLFDLDWVDSDVFHNASRDGLLDPLLKVVRSAESLFVGPPHLHKLGKFLAFNHFIFVPPRDSYLVYKSLLKDICGQIDKMEDGSLVSISAGMPAKLIVHELHRRFGRKHAVVDFGSLFDVYAGVKSRAYMRGMPSRVPVDL